MLDFRFEPAARFLRTYAAVAVFAAAALAASGQTTISTGSIVGTVTDPKGAAVAGANITITDKGTSRVITTASTSYGVYSSGPLLPANYVVRVAAQNFKTAEAKIAVEVGVTSTINFTLELGPAIQVVAVEADTVNTVQSTVQGVVGTQEIENLPSNGRNLLDFAQLEAGVQAQDGGNIDPTKKGSFAVSTGNRFGRGTLYELDGVNISDETVGSTTQNISASGVKELQVAQSMLDLSTELTSSGSVNITTRSGANGYHGQGFYAFRKQSLDAKLPGGFDTPFERNQFGGNFGGALIKDKLFFFVDGERTKQDFNQPIASGFPLETNTGSFSAPFRETNGVGRVDYQLNQKYQIFYRFSYDQTGDTSPFSSSSFQPLASTVNARDHAVGLDFTSGGYTHSVRGGYLKYFNHISSGTAAATPFNPSLPIELAIGADPLCLNNSSSAPDIFCAGQGYSAPQSTAQSDYQVNYNGSHLRGAHIFHFGVGFNRIQGGGFTGFLANGPAVNAAATACTGVCLAMPGGASNPLNYPATNVILANGAGYSTEKSAFGFPAGGLGSDNRISLYAGDTWKKPNFTLTYGLRYVRDTARTDSDLGPISALGQFDNQFYTGLQDRVRNPSLNLAPQLGFTWDPGKSGKTVIRAGAGLFYDNSLWNNVRSDRPGRLATGSFLQTQPACTNGVLQALPFTYTGTNPCNQPIGSVLSAISTLQSDFQRAAAANPSGPNPNFIGTSLQDTGPYGSGTNLLYPGYRTPRSAQMNFGIEHELRPGVVFTVDFLRNVSTHTLLAVDTNHVGDARFLDIPAAQNAIAATLANCGQAVQTIINSYSSPCPTDPANGTTDNGTWAPRPATIVDYAELKTDPAGRLISGGLDSGYSTLGGRPAQNVCNSLGCLNQNTGAAFPGLNPLVGGNQMLFPIGRSVLNAVQATLKEDVRNPFRIVHHLNLQVSYQFSKYVSQAAETDFVNSAWDYANPSKYIGPNGLDRRHQIVFGGTAEMPFHFQLSAIGHFYSVLPTTLTLAPTGQAGGIFVTDVNGSGNGDGSGPNGSNGTLGSILPGTNLGAYDRRTDGAGINYVIDNYNLHFAGLPTPAGSALTSLGLFIQSGPRNDLTALGAVMPAVNRAPIDQADNSWLKDLDTSLRWSYKIRERVEIQPGASFFNVMNLSNFDASKNTLSGVLSLTPQPGLAGGPSAPGTVTSTKGLQPNNLRTGLGSGVFGLGSPRVIEFNLKISF